MKTPACDSWIAILSRYVDEWRRTTGMSHESIAMRMVEVYDQMGGPTIGGDFVRHRDVFAMARICWQRIGRWLDDRTKEKTLMPASFAPVALMAMPEALRLRAANEMMAQLGYMVEPVSNGADPRRALSMTLARLCKEAGEAQAAVASMTNGIDVGEAEAAARELRDLISVATGALRQVEATKPAVH